MTIESKAEGVKIVDEYLIKLEDGATLRMENLNTFNPGAQLPSKTMNTTLLLKKRKS